MPITQKEISEYLAAYNRLQRSWTRNRSSADAKAKGLYNYEAWFQSRGIRLCQDRVTRVDKKMRLSEDKTAVIINKALTLEDIPHECFEYRLGNRSALEWVIDQYQVSTDKRSGIESDPNRLEDPEYTIRLLKQVVTVSIKTVELVRELAEAVTADDWLNETVEVSD
jgi:hypothetical protein